MNGDFSELIQYLDDRFNKVGEGLKDLKEGFDNLQISVDAYAKKADTYL